MAPVVEVNHRICGHATERTLQREIETIRAGRRGSPAGPAVARSPAGGGSASRGSGRGVCRRDSIWWLWSRGTTRGRSHGSSSGAGCRTRMSGRSTAWNCGCRAPPWRGRAAREVLNEENPIGRPDGDMASGAGRRQCGSCAVCGGLEHRPGAGRGRGKRGNRGRSHDGGRRCLAVSG